MMNRDRLGKSASIARELFEDRGFHADLENVLVSCLRGVRRVDTLNYDLRPVSNFEIDHVGARVDTIVSYFVDAILKRVEPQLRKSIEDEYRKKLTSKAAHLVDQILE